jgi:hypothetical protein
MKKQYALLQGNLRPTNLQLQVKWELAQRPKTEQTLKSTARINLFKLSKRQSGSESLHFYHPTSLTEIRRMSHQTWPCQYEMWRQSCVSFQVTTQITLLQFAMCELWKWSKISNQLIWNLQLWCWRQKLAQQQSFKLSTNVPERKAERQMCLNLNGFVIDGKVSLEQRQTNNQEGHNSIMLPIGVCQIYSITDLSLSTLLIFCFLHLSQSQQLNCEETSPFLFCNEMSG